MIVTVIASGLLLNLALWCWLAVERSRRFRAEERVRDYQRFHEIEAAYRQGPNLRLVK
jgi:hypothetical protein